MTNISYEAYEWQQKPHITAIQFEQFSAPMKEWVREDSRWELDPIQDIWVNTFHPENRDWVARNLIIEALRP